jgi:hypothetical protein
MCKYSGDLVKEEKKRRRRNGRDWKTREKKREYTRERNDMYVNRSKRKDPFAETVLY